MNIIILAAITSLFTIVADRPDCHYHAGEVSELTVTVTDTNGVKLTSGKVSAWADNFGARGIVEKRDFDLSVANPFKVTASRATPGFIRWNFSDKGCRKQFGVGYDTDKIRPGTPEPADFDAFWRGAIAKYDREITDPPEMELDSSLSDASWEVLRVSFAAPCGRRVYGFVSKPKGAKERLPGRVEIAAAGYGSWSQEPTKVPGMITLKLTVYPFEPDVKLTREADYRACNERAKAKWGVESYSQGGISESREAYFYYPVILANNRAIDWFACREDIDPGRITYAGTSQGGGLGLAAMALSKRFSAGAVFVPALTDLMSSEIEERQSGWPQLIENQTDENKAAARMNAPYFCGANFARRISIPIRFAVGFADFICAPHAVYAAYNVCPSADKAITDGIGMPHGVYREIYGRLGKWLAECPARSRVATRVQ